MPWEPGDPWPSSTPGGASSPHWGGYVRLWVRAALAAGNVMHAGPHEFDRLDAGNVLAGAPPVLRSGEPIERLWVDLSCDVLDLEIAGGASSSQGIFSKPDAATATITLADPARKYDPLNPDSPYSFGAYTRLVPGTPVEIFAEVIDDPDAALVTVTRYALFTGTADSWGEDWTPRASARRAGLIASDPTKVWARFDRPEQAPEGAGDTTEERVDRLVSYYDWLGPVVHGVSAVTLQATTLAQSGWELLNRTLDDELGVVYFSPEGELVWLGRDTWQEETPPVVTLGCDELDAAAHDVLIDATPSNIDLQMRNAIYAARTGGATQTATSSASISRYGPYDYKRTDLGLADDAQVSEWAALVLAEYAFPQVRLEDVTMRPAISASSWLVFADTLAVRWFADVVRVLWKPPDRPEDDAIEVLARVVGTQHRIARASWETRWQIVSTESSTLAGVIMHAGPHPQDRLDAGFILA